MGFEGNATPEGFADRVGDLANPVVAAALLRIVPCFPERATRLPFRGSRVWCALLGNLWASPFGRPRKDSAQFHPELKEPNSEREQGRS
jgi:hypothetical protein